MNLRYTILIITIFTLAQSCLKDPDVIETIPDCPEFVDLGAFEMAAGSIEYLPYMESVQRVVFSDEQGQEFSAEVTEFREGLDVLTYLTQNPCEEDSTQTFQYKHSAESKSINWEIADLNMSLRFTVRVNVSRKEQFEVFNLPDLDPFLFNDLLNVSLIHPADQLTFNSHLGIVVDPRTHPFSMLTTPDATATINGVTFSDVYAETSQNIGQPAEFDLLYTKEQGLIGIVKKDGTLSLKFERVE